MINKDVHDLSARWVGVGLVVSMLLTACAPLEASTQQPAAAGYPGPATAAAGYPGPTGATPATTALPAATMQPLPANEAIITPPPSEIVQTGPMVLAANPQNNLPFKWRQETVSLSTGTTVRLYLEIQGREVQLGDDNGASSFQSASAQYLAWVYGARTAGLALSRTVGLYVRVINTDQDLLIAPGDSVGGAEVDGDWVLYSDWAGLPKGGSTFPRNGTPGAVTKLIAYNIVTGQSTTISTNVPVIMGRGMTGFYGVAGDRAGWIEYDLNNKVYALRLEDLRKGSPQTLNVPCKATHLFQPLQEPDGVARPVLAWLQPGSRCGLYDPLCSQRMGSQAGHPSRRARLRGGMGRTGQRYRLSVLYRAGHQQIVL